MRSLTLTLIFLFASILPASLYAEEHYMPHISVGAHGGVNLSRVAFTPSVDQSWLMGPNLGVQIRYAEEKLVGVMAELNYGQLGWKEKYEESPLSYSRQLHYLSIPLLTHINFGRPRTKFFFNLGPQFSFLIGQHTSSNFDYTNPTQAEGWPTIKRMTEQLITKVENRFDYGICAGFGCEFYLSPRNSVYLEARYYYGLGNIFPSSKADTFSASRNSSLSMNIGYNFRLE